MQKINKLILQSRAIRHPNFPLLTSDEEALALLPYWLNRSPKTEAEDSDVYDQLRSANIPHSLKELNWTIGKLQEKKILYPDWAELFDDAYHSRRPSKQTQRLHFLVEGIHGGRYATHRGVNLDNAKAIIIAMHGRGAVSDRLTHDLERFIDIKNELAILAPQATDNSWYPNPAWYPPSKNQPNIDDTLAVLDSLWNLARQFVTPGRIIICGFSQGASAALTWIRKRNHSPRAVLAFSGFQIEIGGSYEGLSETYLYCSRSAGDAFCTDENIAKTVSDLAIEAPHADIYTTPGNCHEISEHDGETLNHVIALTTSQMLG